MFNIKGTVTESLPNTMFRVAIEEGPAELLGKSVLCTLNGNMRRFRIRVLPGDNVIAEVSRYDVTKARITRRLRENDTPMPEEAAAAVVEETKVVETQTQE